MDSIKNILTDNNTGVPPQLQALKDYVYTNHNQKIKVSVTNGGYSITVPNASLASTLQMEIPKIQIKCNISEKLYIRIG